MPPGVRDGRVHVHFRTQSPWAILVTHQLDMLETVVLSPALGLVTDNCTDYLPVS